MSGLLLRGVELAGRPGRHDVRVRGDRVAAVAPRLAPSPDERVVDAAGGALLPGLHDHHLHLTALAAAAGSARCGPPEVSDRAGLAAALAAAPAGPGGWVRGTGYHESVAGPLDRHRLDALVADRPVRVQHRSGALWQLNSAAVDALRLDACEMPGVERDGAGAPTGRLWRMDGWLRARLTDLGVASAPDLAAVGRRLAAYGVTGVTDATPDLDGAQLDLLTTAAAGGSLPQRLLLLGAPDGWTPPTGRVAAGPRKLVLADHDLPDLPALTAAVREAHERGRPVAVHCVSREALVLLLAALADAGPLPGDRVEHAALVPAELLTALAATGAAVVTQPGLPAERGDGYLAELDPYEVPDLYRYRSLLDAGVPVAPSSDAPYTDPDPWRAIAAARDRRTPTGREVGTAERVDAGTALAGYLSAPERPGGPPRSVRPPGAGTAVPADLCLLHVPLSVALAAPDAGHVRLTVCAGRVGHEG